MTESNEIKNTQEEKSENNFEMRCGVTIALMAAFLAVTDLYAGKYGEDEIKLTNEKSAAYMWYQSKSIRQTVTEGQRDLLQTLLDGNSIQASSQQALKDFTGKLSKKIDKYDKEKKEILLGSKAVGEANWIQDVEGKLGQVTGAKEYESQIEVLSLAGDKFDLAILFFQISLVIGAISLVIKKDKIQSGFYFLMVGLGSFGLFWASKAFMLTGF